MNWFLAFALASNAGCRKKTDPRGYREPKPTAVPYKPPKLKPSEYVQRHISFSVQHVERVAVELRHHMGVDHIMFATDFPHIECDWPNTRPFAERLFADVPAPEAFKIAAGNMLKYFVYVVIIIVVAIAGVVAGGSAQ